MKIVTAAEMRQIDRATSERFGVAASTLMENAGAAVAEFVLEHWPEARRITVVCGKGNNGGDGLVAARRLSQAGKPVMVALLARASELKGDAAEMLEQLPVEALEITSEGELRDAVDDGLLDCDVALDAILGTGMKPPVTGLYAEAIAALNACAAAVVAVDVPSGADADAMAAGEAAGPVARAEAVVTFTAPKPAHVLGRLTDGPTVVAPIGSPEEAIESKLGMSLITPADFAGLLRARAPEAHKGDFGHVLVIGGSAGKAGAAAMAGMGALRAGAGLVTVAAPRGVQPTVAGFAAELMTEALDETETGGIALKALEYGRIEKLYEGKAVLALGPGLGRHPETQEFVRALIDKPRLPIVLDADGVNAMAGALDHIDGGEAGALVLTPHPGEMARLLGISPRELTRDPVRVASTFAREHRCIVVLKGHRTIVASADAEVWVNATGNPGMAKGGSGDVLTGMMAALFAQGFPEVGMASGSFRKAILRGVLAAVYLHGLAGDLAREAAGERAMLASDILAAVGEAFARAAELAQRETVVINP